MNILRMFVACFCLLVASLPSWADQTIAVLDFEDNTPPEASSVNHMEYLHRAMSELLADNLSRTSGFHLVERLKLQDALDEQKIGSSDLADDDGKVRLGKIVGAQAMVFGSFFSIDGMVRADVRVVDVATSQILFSDSVTGNATDVFGLMQSSADQIAKKLGGMPSREGRSFSPDIWREYDAALALMDSSKYGESLSALQNLLTKHGDFSPAERQVAAVLDRITELTPTAAGPSITK